MRPARKLLQERVGRTEYDSVRHAGGRANFWEPAQVTSSISLFNVGEKVESGALRGVDQSTGSKVADLALLVFVADERWGDGGMGSTNSLWHFPTLHLHIHA